MGRWVGGNQRQKQSQRRVVEGWRELLSPHKSRKRRATYVGHLLWYRGEGKSTNTARAKARARTTARRFDCSPHTSRAQDARHMWATCFGIEAKVKAQIRHEQKAKAAA